MKPQKSDEVNWYPSDFTTEDEEYFDRRERLIRGAVYFPSSFLLGFAIGWVTAPYIFKLLGWG